jgi:DNA-binding response OmpR family regulator
MRIACHIPCSTTFNQVRTVLEPAGFDCCRFPCETALLVALRRRGFDLILVDTEKFSATLICAWLECRTGEKTPLVVLSTAGAADEVARAFDSGAEDFVSRPFAPVELVARLNAVLRRHRQTDARQLIELRGFSLDRTAGTLFDHGIRVALSPREFALAWLLFSSVGNYLSRKALSAVLWGVDEDVSNHTIEQHVYMLRKKLRLTAARGVQLRTAYNKGYRLELVSDAVMPVPLRDCAAKFDALAGAIKAETRELLARHALHEPHPSNAHFPWHLTPFPTPTESAMSWHFRRCSDPACSRPFQVNRFIPPSCDWPDAGKITCPHCGLSAPGEGGSVYLAHALSPQAEAWYNAQDRVQTSA